MTPNCKNFRKRGAILAYLQESKEHPSAETVYAGLKPQIPDLSIGTVYRNLSLFKQQGLAVSLGTVNGVERFDGIPEPHVHFICSQCGRITDLPEVEIPAALEQGAARCTGGRVSGCQMIFSGTCRECLRKEETA